MVSATVLGYPRIGPKRELKMATEAYWAGRLTRRRAAGRRRARLREQVWSELAAAGLDTVPSNTFSFYDQMLDTAVLFDALPERFRAPPVTGPRPPRPTSPGTSPRRAAARASRRSR